MCSSKERISTCTLKIAKNLAFYPGIPKNILMEYPPPLSMNHRYCQKHTHGVSTASVYEAHVRVLILENGRQRNPTYGDSVPSEQYLTEDQHVSPAMPPVAESSSSPSGGLACAIAALAERQQTGGGSSSNHDGNTSTFNMIPGYSRFSNRGEQVTEMYHPSGNSAEDSPELGLAMNRDDGEWGVDHESEAAEVGTSRASSDAAEDAGRDSALPTQHGIEGGFQTVGGPIVPDSFEEQMMLAMAVSLADAQARTSTPGLTWQ